jgi:uncharacterized surface protein with fasciclin (FAS1) repeats
MKKQFLTFAAIATMGIGLVSCGNSNESSESAMADTAMETVTTPPPPMEEQGVMVGGANMVPSKNIVENASNSSEHTTLVAAVKQAGLLETLSGAGPFTVFAPTDAAFNALPAGAVDNLMKDENKAKLKNVLTYHVVSGSMKAADLKDGQKLKTVQGEELTVKVKDGKVWINDAMVTIPDVVSSNGVTHVIDKVVMPKK